MKESHHREAAPRGWRRRAHSIALPGIVATAMGFGLIGPGVYHAGTGAKPSEFVVQIEDSGNFNADGSCHDELVIRRPGHLWSTVLTNDPTMRYDLAAISPDGRFVAFSGTRMDLKGEHAVEQGLYLGSLLYSRSARPRCLTNIAMVAPLPNGARSVPDLAWTPDSRYVVFAARLPTKHPLGQCDILVYRPDTDEVRNLTRTPALAEICPVPSPQSDRVVFMRPVGRKGSCRLEIFTMAITGGSLRRVTRPANTTSRTNIYPRWSPDGTSIEFRGLDRHWWRIPADGSGRAELYQTDA